MTSFFIFFEIMIWSDLMDIGPFLFENNTMFIQ